MDPYQQQPRRATITIPLEKRVALLDRVAAFEAVPPMARTVIAALFEEEHMTKETIVVREGEPGDKVYIVAAGELEVSTNTDKGDANLGKLVAGDLFGEIALIAPGFRRQATVTATADVKLLSLDRMAYYKITDLMPEVHQALGLTAATLLTTKFLKTSSALNKLDLSRIRAIAEKGQHFTVTAGEDLLREGLAANQAYVLLNGELEIQMHHGDHEQFQAFVPAGTLLRLHENVDKASVEWKITATESCELIQLDADDLTPQ